MFLNVSNHPSRKWGEEQRRAAEALGGEIADEPFPDVPPDVDTAAVEALGQEVLRGILARQPAAVMVQGEFTLAFYLVSALKSLRIPCFAATTRRLVETTAKGNGVTETNARFEFVRFRRYA